MKKKYICCILVLVLVAAIVLIGSYFSVRGSEIEGVAEITDSCTVTVEKYRHTEYEDRIQYVLNAAQIQQLKELILGSDFTRVLSNVVSFDSDNQSDILVDFNNQTDYLTIHCIGNEYILVTDQFGGKHLQIRNAQWEATLDSILTATE